MCFKLESPAFHGVPKLGFNTLHYGATLDVILTFSAAISSSAKVRTNSLPASANKDVAKPKGHVRDTNVCLP